MPSRILLIAFLLASACTRRDARPAPPSLNGAPVILISIDTLRADHLPAYGYRNVATPAIDALASESLVFENAYAHCPMTLPSHVSMLTGLLPPEHGVRNNLGFRLHASQHPSVPQLLKANGYATGAAVSSYVLRGDTGLRDAFDFYDDSVSPPAGAAFAEYQRSGAVTTAIAQQWIAGQQAKPFFFFLHLYEPHVPYDSPTKSYDGEIAVADTILGNFFRFLKEKGIYDRALIVLTSDHGEGLGDHGEEQHSILLYREAIHVPLIVKLPERRAGRITGVAASVDIARTIADMANLPLKTTSAVSLFQLPAEREVYAETLYPYLQLGWSDLRSVISTRFHYIESPRPELYDLQRDPAERDNVIEKERRKAAALRTSLARYPQTAAVPVVDSEAASRLSALGYIGNVRSRPDPRTLPNPRDSIGILGDLQKGFRLADEQRFQEAVVVLEDIVKRQPRMVEVWIRLGQVHAAMGNHERALEDYKRASQAAGVFSPEIVAMIGDAALEAGRWDEAERIGRELPDDVLLAETLASRGDYAGALQAVGRVRTPVYGADAIRGEIYARTDHPREAIAAFEREIAVFPSNRLAYARLALLHFAMGDRKNGDRVLQRLVTANPTPVARDLAKRTRDAVQ
ncbi:MAG TPA: sulfatase-like hydrolase/transferase [Thermoanaerobaculia bacterium]|nr:sulfatase-like hydrolase/transferase [Thermoanaerobaculia bacterium]